jgi:hypothetical protein
MKPCSPKVFLAFILIGPPATAQLMSLDINPTTQMVRYNDPATIGRKNVDVDYRDVGGRYLWSNDWSPAMIIMKGGNATKMRSVRLNLYSNEIHYLTSEGEMAAGIEKVRRVIVYSNSPSDSTTIVGAFDVFPNLATRKECFNEIMNEGSIQLLRRATVTIKKERFDPATGKDEFYFHSTYEYFVRNEKILKPLKSFGKNNIFEVVPQASSEEAWLSSNKNKLRKSEDVVDFFTYLNKKNK